MLEAQRKFNEDYRLVKLMFMRGRVTKQHVLDWLHSKGEATARKVEDAFDPSRTNNAKFWKTRSDRDLRVLDEAFGTKQESEDESEE